MSSLFRNHRHAPAPAPATAATARDIVVTIGQHRGITADEALAAAPQMALIAPEPTKQRPGDQPLPTAGRECVQDALIAQIEERKRLGIERYGRPLETHNGRNALQDAREEAVDLAVYLMQVELEDRDAKAELDALRPLIDRLLTAQGQLFEHWADAATEPTMTCRNAMWAELHTAAYALEDHLTNADARRSAPEATR